jgi:hypothetical protein
MRCYNHSDTEAVAICKSCGKALCQECAIDLGRGIACQGQCEADVQMLISIVDNNAKTYSTVKSRSLYAPIFFIIVGIIFGGYGMLSGNMFGFMFVLGVCFVLYGVIAMIANRKYIGQLDTGNE